MQNQIIVALDNMTSREAIDFASRFEGKVWGFKINDLLIEYGAVIVNELKRFGHVFADPKLHDIPQTVHNTVSRLDAAGADFITVHASGGVDMLTAAVKACKRAKILGVTALTSLRPDAARSIYRGYPMERFCHFLCQAKVPGVICSGDEIPYWGLFDFVKVVPAVRPFGPVLGDDQRRITRRVKADYVVIGRPLTRALDPERELDLIERNLTS